MTRRTRLMLVMSLLGVSAGSAQTRPQIGSGVKHARASVEALSATSNRARVLVTLAVDPGWHVSWRNPGETGLPTRLTWTLPGGVRVHRERWPVPIVSHTPVGATHTLEGDVPWVVEFAVDSATPADRLVSLTIRYGICREVCIPEQVTVQGVLPGRAMSRAVAIPPVVEARLTTDAGRIAARRLSPTVICLDRVPVALTAPVAEFVADSGVGLDAAIPLQARTGRAAGSALLTVPATHARISGLQALFVRGGAGVWATLDFRQPARRCAVK